MCGPASGGPAYAHVMPGLQTQTRLRYELPYAQLQAKGTAHWPSQARLSHRHQNEAIEYQSTSIDIDETRMPKKAREQSSIE